MDLKNYLATITAGSKLLEKASMFQTITILWYLKENVNKEEAENFLNEIQKTIKTNVKGINIEFKLVDEIEIAKEEIIYVPKYIQGELDV